MQECFKRCRTACFAISVGVAFGNFSTMCLSASDFWHDDPTSKPLAPSGHSNPKRTKGKRWVSTVKASTFSSSLRASTFLPNPLLLAVSPRDSFNMNLHLLCECLGPVNQALAELQMAPLSTNDFPAVTACKRQLSELDIYIEIRRKINAYVSVCYECDTMPGPKGHSPGQRTLLGLFCPGAGTATHCDVRVGALCCELANLFTLSNGLPVDGSVSPLIDVSRRLVSVGGDKGYFPAATLGSFLLGLRCGPARMAFVRGDFESPNTIRTLGRGPTSANRIKAVQECLRRIRFHVDEIGHASCGEPLPGCHVDYVHEGLTALRLWMRLPGVASLDIGEAPCSLAQIVDELLPAVIDSCYVTDSPVDFEVSSGFVIP